MFVSTTPFIPKAAEKMIKAGGRRKNCYYKYSQELKKKLYRSRCMRHKRDINGLRLVSPWWGWAGDAQSYLQSMMRKIFIAAFRHKYPPAWKRKKTERNKVEWRRRKRIRSQAEAGWQRILKIMTIDFLTISYSISHWLQKKKESSKGKVSRKVVWKEKFAISAEMKKETKKKLKAARVSTFFCDIKWLLCAYFRTGKKFQFNYELSETLSTFSREWELVNGGRTTFN